MILLTLIPLMVALQTERPSSCESLASELGRANQALNDGKSEDAEAILSSLQAGTGECPKTLLLLGRAKAAGGMPTAARNLLTEYTQSVPNDSVGHLALGQLLWEQRDYGAADASVDAALRLNPREAKTVLLKAEIQDGEGQQDEARRLFEQASQLAPHDVEVQLAAGKFFDRHQESSRAIAVFRQVLKLDSANPFAWDYLGLGYEREGDALEAEKAYQRGLAVNQPPHFDPFLPYNLGRILAKRGRLSESEQYLNDAVRLSPKTRAVYYERARLYLLLNNFAGAQADAERALQLPDPGQYIQDPQVYSLLAIVYERLSQKDLARQYAALARETKLLGSSKGRQ